MMRKLPCIVSNSFVGARFLFVLGQYAKLGGAERQTIVLTEELKNKVGVYVDFLAWGGEGRVSEDLASPGARPRVFPLGWDNSPQGRLIKLWQVARFIRQRREVTS